MSYIYHKSYKKILCVYFQPFSFSFISSTIALGENKCSKNALYLLNL